MTEQLTSRTLEVGPFTTHVTVGGDPDATPVVLLHDGTWGADGMTSWSAVADDLRADHRLIIPDLLGYGRSAKVNFFDRSPYTFRIAHLGALLEELGEPRPVHLVGSSFGGSVALRAAIDAPFPLASVISIGGTGGPWRRAEGKELLGRLVPGREYMAAVVAAIAGSAEGLDEQVERRLAGSLRAGHYAALASLGLAHPEAGPPPDDGYPARLAEATCPVTVVDMTDDLLNEDGWTQHLRAANPAVRVVSAPGPHSPNLTDPRGTAALVRELLAG